MSHPVRGAWIEILMESNELRALESHPVRGAWIEISNEATWLNLSISSHPVRGAWIEIVMNMTI